MAKVHKTYPSPYNGISEQVDELMIDSQCKDMVNCIPDLIQGLSKRPPAVFVTWTAGNTLLPDNLIGHYPLHTDAFDYLGANDGIEYNMLPYPEHIADALDYDGTRAYFDGNSYVLTQFPYTASIQSTTATFTLTDFPDDPNPKRSCTILHWSTDDLSISPANNLVNVAVSFEGVNQDIPYLTLVINNIVETVSTPLTYHKEYTLIVDSLGKLYLDGVLVLTHSESFDLSNCDQFMIGGEYDSVDIGDGNYNDGFIGYISDVYVYEGGLNP